jgi:hypothetical protein
MTLAGNTRVLGQLDAMTAFAGRSTLRAEDLVTFGYRVVDALDAFNSQTEASFRVDSHAGRALVGLGQALNDLDTFVSQIAGQLRSADTGTISQPIAATAVAPRLPMITQLERTANRATTALLKENFALLDTLNGGAENGKISISRLEYLAQQTEDSKLAAAATWLQDHPMVMPNMDTALRTTWVGENGDLKQTAYPSKDYLIEMNEILDYERRRESFYTLTDAFAAVDSGDALGQGAGDGKISDGELHKVQMDASNSTELRNAAGLARHNNDALNGLLFNNDDIAGVYDLDQVAALYTDPRLPLGPRKTALHKAICNTASYYSYLGWIDFATTGNALAPHQYVTGKQLETQGKVARQGFDTTRAARLTAGRVVMTGNVYVSGTATAIDGYCRVTDPNTKTWGKVRPKQKLTAQDIENGKQSKRRATTQPVP